jgi:hypothetical protein
MFFHHKPTGQICGGKSLQACVVGDFCAQSRDVIANSPEPRDLPIFTEPSPSPTEPKTVPENEAIQFLPVPVENEQTEVKWILQIKDFCIDKRIIMCKVLAYRTIILQDLM